MFTCLFYCTVQYTYFYIIYLYNNDTQVNCTVVYLFILTYLYLFGDHTVLTCIYFSIFSKWYHILYSNRFHFRYSHKYTRFSLDLRYNFTFNIYFLNQKTIHDIVKTIHVSRKSIHVKSKFWLPAGHTRRGRHTVIQIEPTV